MVSPSIVTSMAGTYGVPELVGTRKYYPCHATRRYSLDLTTDANMSSDAVLLKIDRFGQRF